MEKSCQAVSREPIDINDLADRLKALSDKHRLRIIVMLSAGERCVCEIYQALDLPQNLVSHHLKVLKEAGLVESRRDGTWMRYQLSYLKGIPVYERVLEKAMRIVGRRKKTK